MFLHKTNYNHDVILTNQAKFLNFLTLFTSFINHFYISACPRRSHVANLETILGQRTAKHSDRSWTLTAAHKHTLNCFSHIKTHESTVYIFLTFEFMTQETLR